MALLARDGLLVLVALVAFRSASAAVDVALKRGSAVGQDLEAWDRALHNHVRPGMMDNVGLSIVDYKSLAADPDFQAFIESLATVKLETLSELEWKAFLINAYNALAMNFVIQHPCQHGPQNQCQGPIQYPGDLAGVRATIGGQSTTLGQIEDMLRSPPAPFQADPRIHACLNCASVSCPNLRTEAYQAHMLNAQMDEQMKMFVMNPQKGLSLDQKGNKMTLSTIFKWSRADFEHASKSVPAFVSQYLLSEDERAYIAASNPQIGYFPWDRNLNGEAPCSCAAGGPAETEAE